MRVSEFVMSNELVSMTLAMVSESREVNTILKELFTPEGNELYVHPASRYLRSVLELSLVYTCCGTKTTCRVDTVALLSQRLAADALSRYLKCVSIHKLQ